MESVECLFTWKVKILLTVTWKEFALQNVQKELQTNLPFPIPKTKVFGNDQKSVKLWMMSVMIVLMVILMIITVMINSLL